MTNPVASVFRQIGPRLALRGAVLVAVLIAAGLAINRYSFEDILQRLDFSRGGDGWLNGAVAFFALGALFTAIGGPRQAVSFFAAYFFGLAKGFLVALLATLTGCLVALAAALVFGSFARDLIRGRVIIALRMWKANAFGMTLMLRLLPVGSNLLTNLTAGVAGIPVSGFLAGSAVGYIPQTAVFALMGAGVNVGSQTQILLSVILFALSVGLGIWIYADHRKSLRRNLDDKAPAERR